MRSLAISIVMVILLHTLQRFSMTHHVAQGWYVLANGALSVRIFFVLSGYLITRLLLREQAQTGRISLSRFYMRRAFRILPPLYVYLALLLALILTRHLVSNPQQIVASALFLRNYFAWANGFPPLWALEHTWSLCIEEQFYLLWPAILVVLLARRGDPAARIRSTRIGLLVIAVSPVIRVLSFRTHSEYLHNIGMFHMQADLLVWGCIAALMEGHASWERVYSAITRVAWLPPVLIFGVFATMGVRFQNYWSLPLGITLDGCLLSFFLVWTVRNAETPLGHLLNLKPMRAIGVLSYSLYLWQTFFLHHESIAVFGGKRWMNTFPGSWLAIFACATASYFLVEQPALRLRDRLAQRRSPV